MASSRPNNWKRFFDEAGMLPKGILSCVNPAAQGIHSICSYVDMNHDNIMVLIYPTIATIALVELNGRLEVLINSGWPSTSHQSSVYENSDTNFHLQPHRHLWSPFTQFTSSTMAWFISRTDSPLTHMLLPFYRFALRPRINSKNRYPCLSVWALVDLGCLEEAGGSV